MFRKTCMNVVFLCVVSLLAVGAVNCPPLAGAQGVESLSVPAADQGGVDSYTKLMLHADGSDQGTLSPAGGGVGGGVFSRTVLPALKL